MLRRTVPLSLLGLCGVCACAGRPAQVESADPSEAERPEASWPVPLGVEPQATVHLPALSSGRRMRGDWEPPDALLLAYVSDWRDSLADVIAAARSDTQVFVLANAYDLADPDLGPWLDEQGVSAIAVNHDTPWIRDYGPIEVIEASGQRLWLDLVYYDDRPLDDAFPRELSWLADVSVETHPLPSEGGAVASNGRGVCAMTEQSFHRALREDVTPDGAQDLVYILGCDALAVVPTLSGEATGHVDVLAQFLAPDLVAVAEADPVTDPIAAAELDAAANAIVEAGAAVDQRMRVVRLPMRIDGEVFFSYINGTRLRSRFLVPSYTQVPDRDELTAHVRLRRAMPRTQVVPIYADPMVAKGGAVHCVTLGLSWPLPTRKGS